MSSRKLVIFDCDGTLVDSQNVIVTAMNEAFRQHGFEPPSRTASLSIVGLSLIEAMQVLMPEGGKNDHIALANGYKSVFQQFTTDPQLAETLYDGAKETVLRLAARPDVILGVATGKSQRGVRRVLEHHGLQGCFATIQTADDAPSKPHPAMIYQAMEEAGVDAGNTFMVGDTTYDIEMAHRAGVTAIGVAWGYHTQASITSLDPTYFVNDFNKLNGVFDKYIERIPGHTHGQ